MTVEDVTTPTERAAPPASAPKPRAHKPAATGVIVTVIFAAIIAASVWYLVQPQTLVVQGEADSTRVDMAARVDGRIARKAVERGQDVAAGTPLIVIDNPELLAKQREAEATLGIALAEQARITAGTRKEVVAVRRAEIARAEANLTLAQQSHERVRQLAADRFAPQQKLDEATDALQVARRGVEQAKLAYDEAVAGFTREERGMADAKVAKAEAAVATLKALVDQLTVVAPIAAQVYQLNIEQGEVVGPGVPLLSLVDLADIWLRFDLREDLMRGLKVGDRIEVRLPALDNRTVAAEVRLIAAKGEYAGWRATRATGDFDLRTFQIRAYPVEPVPGLRPGMSAYASWHPAAR
jgi:HlyD family secretion protein